MMKQKQIALAAVLVSLAGSAFAQSNVTIYGTVDTGIGRTYTNDASVNLADSYDSTTLLGFRGSEDLGNGLKANFQLEASGIKSDTGAWGDGFKRQSWIGVSGSFGEVMMGRTTTPQNRIMGTFDLNGTASGSSAMGALGIAANGSFLGSRQSNQIQYASPNMGGFQARVAYAMSENADTGLDAQKDFFQLAASYKNGGLTVGAAFQPKSQSLQTKADNDKYRNGYSLGAKYNFGVAEASVLYTRNEQLSQGDGWGIGVAAPFGALKVGVQYARITKLDATHKQAEGANAFELFADYNLSKRTSVYANYGSVNNKAKVWKGFERDNTFAVGVTHKF